MCIRDSIDKYSEGLNAAWQAASQDIYNANNAGGGAAGGPGAGAAGAGAGNASQSQQQDEGPHDVEFEEVK